MKHKLILLYSWLIRSIMYFFPDIPIIMRLRGWLYGLAMKTCGKNLQISNDALLLSLENIIIGSNVFIGNMTIVNGATNSTITIGNNVLIGPMCSIQPSDHISENGSFRYGKTKGEDIIISNNSWIGSNSVILRGAILPEKSILAANSCLNKPFTKQKTLYCGSPAIPIKEI